MSEPTVTQDTGSALLEEIVCDWAARQIGDDGLAEVNCCGARVVPSAVSIYRMEEPCEARLSPDGRVLVVGVVYRYEGVCPACAAVKRTGQVFIG